MRADEWSIHFRNGHDMHGDQIRHEHSHEVQKPRHLRRDTAPVEDFEMTAVLGIEARLTGAG